MILLADPDRCTGCGACGAVCPVGAITMIQEDKGGFYRPTVDGKTCVKCEECRSICPELCQPAPKNRYYGKVYAANNKNGAVRDASSSGGIFAALASWAIKQGGCVAGAAYDTDLRVVHKLVDHREGLRELVGSKYVQSDMGFVYKEVCGRLAQGKAVFFCGTPCQVLGIKRFAEKERLGEKLFTADLLCRGVPSPKAFRKYLEMTENRYGKKVIHVKFKDKEKGWHNVNTRITMEDRSECYLLLCQSTYAGGFLDHDMTAGESCFHCRYKTMERWGDITIGDFWGLKNTKLVDDKGTSAVMVNSEKGALMWDGVRAALEYKESTMWRVIKGNRMAFSRLPENPAREQFWEYLKQYTYDEALEMANDLLEGYKKAYGANMEL